MQVEYLKIESLKELPNKERIATGKAKINGKEFSFQMAKTFFHGWGIVSNLHSINPPPILNGKFRHLFEADEWKEVLPLLINAAQKFEANCHKQTKAGE